MQWWEHGSSVRTKIKDYFYLYEHIHHLKNYWNNGIKEKQVMDPCKFSDLKILNRT